MTTVHAHAVREKGGPLSPFEYSLGEIGPDQIDISVESCGICHSDLALIDDEWGISRFPVVPGHEVVGTVLTAGSQVKNLKAGQRVGLGWYSGSCMHCQNCMHGDHNLCSTAEPTIVGRHGGFADLVRCHSAWAIALPDALDARDAGPLFCGGITVFNPLVQFDVRPTQRVGVIGIGGLGHMALQFMNKWGCEVTAFSSSPGKEAEAKQMGAHHVVNSRDSAAMAKRAGHFDLILNTANANLDWPAYLNALAPRGACTPWDRSRSRSPRRVRAHRRTAQHLGIADGQPGRAPRHAGVHGPTPDPAGDAAFPDERREQGVRPSAHGKARYRVVLDRAD